MDKETVQIILEKGGELVTNLAEKMGQTGTHIYEVFVRQQYVDGLGNLIGFSVFAVVALIGLVLAYKFSKNFKYSGYDEAEARIFSFFGILIVWCISWAFLIGGIATSIKKMINPEYYAIQQIVETVRGEVEGEE